MSLLFNNQTNTIQLGTDGQTIFDEHSSSPSTPSSGNVTLYAKADGLLYSKDDAGVETLVSGGTGGGGSVTSVGATQPAAGLTISSDTTNPITTAGTFTFALANDLAALEGLGSTGIAVRTAGDTWAQRSIETASASRITVTNGTGVSGNPTLDLATLADGGTGTFLKLTRDTYGRVSGTTAVIAGDITTLVDASYVNVGGDTMTGFLTLNALPTADLHAATKSYVDNLASGLDPKASVQAATTVAGGNIPGYAAGVITVPNANATYFPDGAGPLKVDGVALAIGNRVLVKDQTDAKQNGIYSVTTAGVQGSVNGVLTRATDHDGTPANEVSGGNYTFVEGGSTNISSGWVLQGSGILTLDTDNLVWIKFSEAGAVSFPSTEIVIGTGSGLASDADFTYTTTNGQFRVNTNNGSAAISVTTPADVAIMAPTASGANTAGGDILILSGNGLGTGIGGNVNITAGDGGGTAALAGNVTLKSGAKTGTGTAGGIVEIVTQAGFSRRSNSAIVANPVEDFGLVYGTTTNATPTELFVDGTTEEFVLSSPLTANQGALFTVSVVGNSIAGVSTAAYEIKGCVINRAGTTAIIGSLIKTVIAEDTAGWDVTVEAVDDIVSTNGTIRVMVTGAAATTINWVGSIRMLRTTNAS